MAISVTLGFLPSYRFRWTPWTRKMREDSLATLQALTHVKVVAPEPSADDQTLDAEHGLVPHGGVHTLDEAETVAEYFARQRVDGLVVCPLDFGDERSVSKVAEKLRVPIFLYATKEPPARDDASMARISDSYCGNLSIAAGLHRRRLPFYYAGIFFPDESELRQALDAFVRAVAVAKGLRGARIGQVGTRPPTFETVAYDEVAMATKFGQNVIYRNMADIVDRAQAMADDDPQVAENIERIKRYYQEITVAKDHLLKSAKVEAALAEFYTQEHLSAMAVQCWPTIQRMMRISLCAIFGRLTERHMLTACETDVMGSLAMLTNYQAALGETLPHFVDWTIQHREDPNVLLAWHCGNAPVSLAQTRGEIALRSRYDMKGVLPVEPGDPQAGLAQFRVRPGRVTFCRLAEYDGEWKMLIAPGEIIPSEETLAGTWAWVRVRDHARLYRTLVEEGFIHHASMIHGDQVEALKLACKFLDIQPIVVE